MGATITKGMKRKQTRKFGYSYTVEFISRPETSTRPAETEVFLMSTTTLGRKRPRKMVDQIEEYLKREVNDISAKEFSGFDWKGIVFLILGIISLLFCIILGQFAEPK